MAEMVKELVCKAGDIVGFLMCLSSFPDDSDSEGSACSAGDLGLIPGLGRSPGEGNGNPFQDPCLENPMERGAWWLQSMGLQRVRLD